MKARQLNLLLGGVALALVATVFLTRKKPEAGGAPLTQLTREAITRITLTHPGAADIVLEKAAGTWSLTAPVRAGADAFAVASLLGFANTETRSTLDVTDPRANGMGLDPPGYTLRLDDTLLKFGEVEPLRYTRYVQVEDPAGTRVVTIDDIGGTATDADYTDLVSRALLPDDAVVTAIEVPGLRVGKAATGPGWTSDPVDAVHDSDSIQRFVNAWRDAKSLFNQAPDGAGKPADRPETATVRLADGSSRLFRIVARAPQLVLARDDLHVQYTLAAPLADQLLKLPAVKPETPSAAGSTPAGATTPVPAPRP